VVLVAQRLDRGLIDNRVGAFPQVFGVADSRSKSADGRSKTTGWMETNVW